MRKRHHAAGAAASQAGNSDNLSKAARSGFDRQIVIKTRDNDQSADHQKGDSSRDDCCEISAWCIHAESSERSAFQLLLSSGTFPAKDVFINMKHGQ